VRTSKPCAAGSMQVSLIGLRHLEQAKIPISARLLNNGSGWMEDIAPLPLLRRERAAHSQSPMDAEGGAVMETSMEPKSSAAMVNIAQIRKFLIRGVQRTNEGSRAVAPNSEIGTNRTNRAGLMMSAVRGKAENICS
jgi:hypothetical protein